MHVSRIGSVWINLLIFYPARLIYPVSPELICLLSCCITAFLTYFIRSGYTKAPTVDENAISIGSQFPFPTTALHAESSLLEKKASTITPQQMGFRGLVGIVSSTPAI
ncbi:predicted protein [Histoplasma capsulatum H143]|uniref:Uncharacterized protein n=1 Tax=Ajellomyces capsulatus (strain H143) TaxID=544712 RepID=C6HIM3_AJECH|nr:predicted protein [Histoplasma capsulatum H143]